MIFFRDFDYLVRARLSVPAIKRHYADFLRLIFLAFVVVLVVLWNISRSFFSGKCSYISHFLEHLRENFRRLLLFWLFCGTFAGKFPAFVVVLADSQDSQDSIRVLRASFVLRVLRALFIINTCLKI